MDIKDNKEECNEWSKHLTETKENLLYSGRRMDLLIITICGAGIYIVFETLKAIKIDGLQVDLPLLNILKLSGVFLLISIISNFLSQQSSYRANKYEEEYTRLRINSLKGEKIDLIRYEKVDQLSINYDRVTGFLNKTSVVLMIFGLLLLARFSFRLF